MAGKPNAGLIDHVVRFGMTSGLSAALSLGLPVLLHEGLGIAVQIAVATGFATSYLANFVMLRSFVFRSQKSLKADLPRYLVVNGSFRVIEYFAFLGLYEGLSMNYALAVLIILTLSTIMKFFGYRRLFGR